MSTAIRGVMPLGMADGTLSRQIWGNFPWASADSPHFKGTFFYDKFNKGLGQWTTFIDTGGTITPSVDLANDEFGAVELTTDADDNQAVEMQAGQAGAMAKFINPAVTAAYDIYFEARFSLGAVVGNCFVGLMEYVTPAGDHITDAGALRDSDFIGFSTLEATPTILELTHKEEGSTVVVDGAIETLAADEVVQVGFVYRPNLHPASRWVTVYETNVRSAVAISKATCLLSTFPMGVAAAGDQKLMCPTIAVKNVTDITSLRCEWIACGMVPS